MRLQFTEESDTATILMAILDWTTDTGALEDTTLSTEANQLNHAETLIIDNKTHSLYLE